jgi:hypothetical protein
VHHPPSTTGATGGAAGIVPAHTAGAFLHPQASSAQFALHLPQRARANPGGPAQHDSVAAALYGPAAATAARAAFPRLAPGAEDELAPIKPRLPLQA